MIALILDDSKTMRMILKRAVHAMGFDVVEAGNGQEALDRLSTAGEVALALVDWNMPVMDGLEFVCRVRQRPEYDAMRVMMVTTECELDAVMRALEAGADEYLMKPFTQDALREKLAMLSLDEAVGPI